MNYDPIIELRLQPRVKTFKNMSQTTLPKTKQCTWDDLKNDPEQQAIYIEAAKINAYLQQKAHERNLKH